MFATVPVHDDRGALGREGILVRVAADGGDAGQPEVEGREREADRVHEGDEVAAQACVHVQRQVVPVRIALTLLINHYDKNKKLTVFRIALGM